MSNIIQAIYEQGVFRPIEPVNLRERTRIEFEPRVVEGAAPLFWRSQSLDELATQQGVSPISNLDELSDLWPADDDPDEMFKHIQREREARRSLSAMFTARSAEE